MARKKKPPVEYVAGRVWLWVPDEPPATTHHSKIIVTVPTKPRMGKDGTIKTTRQMLADDKRLRAARDFYAAMLPYNRKGTAIKPPLRLEIVFRFRGEQRAWWAEKPDCDNAAKTLTDALVERGWIERDEQIVDLAVSKVQSTTPGVLILLETIDRDPATSLYYVPMASGRGVIRPQPEGGDLERPQPPVHDAGPGGD